MRLRSDFSAIFMCAAMLLPGAVCAAQTPQPPSIVPAKSQPSGLLRKDVIERHFESRQPRPRQQFGGALPGSRLLAMHAQRAGRLQARPPSAPMATPAAASAGTAQPGIQLRPALDAGEIPTSVVTGDFNGDGHLDFVVANGLTSDLWFYPGNGDGTFQLPRVIPLTKGLAPVALAAADTRKSGKLDLIVAESDTSTIGILFNNGDGTFGYETEYPLPEPPGAIVIDDFNHDGKLDIAAVMVTTVDPGTTAVPYLAVLLGDGTGKFSNPIITANWGFYSTAWNLASGDVNGDGLPDLLITGPGIENSTVYLNHGDGTFSQGPVIMESGAFNLVIDGRLADINGDGCLDAVVADANSDVWIRMGDCAGNFAPYTWFAMGDSNAAVAIVDVNGDGIPDIVTSSLPALDPADGSIAGNSLSVALGLGGGKFGTPRNYIGAGQAYSFAVADFNGDGKPDFVTANNDTDTMTVYQNDGSGGFGFPQGVFAGVPAQGVFNAPVSSLSFVDFNQDGKTDAFLLDEGYNGEYYATSFLNDGTGKFSAPVSSDTGLAITTNWMGDYRLGNFRNAQHLDLVGIGLDQSFSGSGQFIVFLAGNSDGTFSKGTPVPATGADGILTTGDFNHDGKLDFVAVNGTGTHTLTTFLGNGDGTFRGLAPVTFSDPEQTYALRIYTGDFNRDGKLDVLIFTSGNGYWADKACVWELDGKGDGTFQAPRQLFTGFQPFALADLNGDGYPDIARYDFMWPDGTTETLGPAKFTNYLDQPDGTFAQSSSYAPYAGVPSSVKPYMQNGDPLSSSLVADLNGDGKLDEIAFQNTAPPGSRNYAQVLMGNGDGTFTPTYDVFPFYLLRYPLYAHDLDGDGAADLVDVVVGSSSLQVFKGTAAPALQIALNDKVVNGNASCGWVFPNLASSSARTATLSSSVTGVDLPSSVTIPATAVSAEFCYTLAPSFNWRQVFDINAQLSGDTATAYASSAYTLGFAVGLSSVAPALLYSGQSTDPVTVTVTASPGYSSAARLSCEGLAPGDSCRFASDSLSISPAAAATTTVVFATASHAANYGNTHSFTVVVDDGSVIHRQSASVTVTSLFMYSLSDPILMGAPGSMTENVSLLGIPPYALTCSGLPAGATCSFSGSAAPYPSSSSMTMVLATNAATPPGSYPVTVTATSGPESTSQSFTLDVLNLNIQGPDASRDWVLVGGEQTATLMVSSNLSLNTYSPNVSCSLDVGGTCNASSVLLSQTPQPMGLTIIAPPDAPTGQHVLTVTAVVGGDSQTFTFPFYVADYSGTLDTTSLSLSRGGSGKVNATLNATTDFAETITLACSGSYQINCSFSPPSTSLTGGTPQTVAITLTAGTSATVTPLPRPFSSRGLLSLAALVPLGLLFGLRRRRWTSWFALLVGIALFVPAISCGSGSGSSGGGGGGGGGGSNTYSITVTAAIANTTPTRTLGTVNVTVTH